MESFSLLKYWRASSNSTSSVATGGGASSTTNASTTTTIASSASSPDSHATEAAATGEAEEEGGSFFDLEFASVPNEDESDSVSESDVEEGEANEKQIFTSLVSLETLNAAAAADDDAKSLHHSPVSLLKSATRLRVFALALNKKLLKTDANVVDSPKNSSSSSNFFIEVFTGSRNNSSKSKAPDEDATEERKFNSSSKSKAPDHEDPTEERKFSKDVLHKYINSKIKPLYVRVSRRYGELRFSGPLTAVGGNATAKKKKKKVMVKSRSAVAAVTSMPPVAAAVQRRDDSLLQQEDGIQSAIAHCKKSFNASSKETKTLVVDEGEKKE